MYPAAIFYLCTLDTYMSIFSCVCSQCTCSDLKAGKHTRLHSPQISHARTHTPFNACTCVQFVCMYVRAFTHPSIHVQVLNLFAYMCEQFMGVALKVGKPHETTPTAAPLTGLGAAFMPGVPVGQQLQLQQLQVCVCIYVCMCVYIYTNRSKPFRSPQLL